MIALACALAAGCSATDRPEFDVPHVALDGVEVVRVDPWPETDAVDGGFDVPNEAETWAPGDSVLFSLEVSTGEEHLHRLLEIVLLERSRSRAHWETRSEAGGEESVATPLVWCIASAYEWDGRDERSVRRVRTQLTKCPEVSLRAGLFEYSRLIEALGTDPAAWPEDRREEATGWLFAAMGLSRIVGQGSIEWEVAQRLVDSPSLLSILLHLGVRMSITQGEGGGEETGWRSEPVEVSLGGRARVPGRRIPLALEINGRPALYASIVVTRVVPPLGPGNGIVLVEARHPSDPEKWLRVRLAGARRHVIDRTLDEAMRDMLKHHMNARDSSP